MKKTHNIEEILTALLEKLGVTVTRIAREERGEQVFYVVHTPDGVFLLERGAEGVRALNTLVRQLCADDESRFSIDVNNAQLKRVDALRDQAQLLARRAESLDCEVEMPPMSSYDRMIVHEALKDNPRIKTESRGEGHLRHVVIVTV